MANQAIVAACAGLCGALAERSASVDIEEVTGLVRPVWAEVGEDVLRGYLQRENSMGSDTTAAGFRGKSGNLGLPKKALDKGPPW